MTLMGVPSQHHRIRSATGTLDVDLAAGIVAEAFTVLQASAWLVPQPGHRRDVLARVFTIVIAHALDHGRIDLLTGPTTMAGPDGTMPVVGTPVVGAAVWFHREYPFPPPPDYTERLRQAAGSHAARFEALDDLFDEHQPDEPHHHLALLAVLPDYQRSGIGGELLRHHQSLLDADQIPAYLEASSHDSRRLYLEHGYRSHGAPFTVPNGAAFHPMWREPESA
jgi:ribosomal protein S18 acetylase RimI-like enzyme